MPNWQDPELDWDDGNVDHLIERHGIHPEDVEEVFRGRVMVRRVGDFYEVLGRTLAGRYLFMVCVRRGSRIRVFSARDMTPQDRRRYERR